MSAKTTSEEMQKEEIMDDVTNEEVKASEDQVDLSKLAALKAKSQAKQQETKMASKIVAKKERSLSLGVVGSGQAGSRIAEAFYKLGYDTVVMNTAMQDLKFIDIPDSNKLLLEYGVGGASKELSIGAAAAEAHKDAIAELINGKLSTSKINVLCLSLGGGSGAGSCDTMIEVLSQIGKPIVVMTVLPMDTEDSLAKSNTLETLSKLTNYAKSKKISNLIVIDNAKLESIYHDVSQMDFYSIANKAIVEPLDIFNTYSAMPSSTKALDSMEFLKVLIDGEGLSVYGELTIDNYTEETSIAEAVVSNLNGNLLASGFDLTQSRYVGFMVIANKTVWSKIPAASINYAAAMINDLCGSPKGVFKGIYVSDSTEDVVKVYSLFSGLGLPSNRVDQLKKETQKLQNNVKAKDEQRNLTLQLDTGINAEISAAQKIKNQIAAKNSTFGKFLGSSVKDRRK